MPRIPEGKFNKTPSVRVGKQNVPAPQKTGFDRALSATQQLTSAMAKLQDQQERTEAYNKANDIKRGYESQKARYLTSLENAGADGNYSYPDPLTSDTKNPEIIKGNINEDYKKLVKYYEDSHSGLQDLNRADIAGGLTQQYVGDDLRLLQVKTGKQMVRKQQRLQTDNLMNNINGSMLKVLDLSASSSPAVIDANFSKAMNDIDREMAVTGQAIGKENLDKVAQYKDRVLQQTATQVLNKGMNQNSMKVAGMLIHQIKDPTAKANAGIRLESIKETQALKSDRLVQTKAASMYQSLMSKPFVDSKMIQQATEASNKLKASYHDPKYSQVTMEERNDMIRKLDAAILSKHVTQEGLDQVGDLAALDDLENAQRELASVGEAGLAEAALDPVIAGANLAAAQSKVNEAEARVNDFLDRGIASSGLGKMSKNPEEKMKLYNLAKQDLKRIYDSMGDNLASMKRAKNPEQPHDEFYAEMDVTADKLRLGDVSYVPKETATAFRTKIKEDLKKSAGDAISTVNSAMVGAGPSHARSVMLDLTKGDKKLEPLIFAADMKAVGNEEMAALATSDMALIARTESIQSEDTRSGRLSPTALENAFNAKVVDGLDLHVQSNKAMSAVKMAIENRAKAIMLTSGETDTEDAMEDAFDQIGKYYSIKKGRDGKDVLAFAGGQIGGLSMSDPSTSKKLQAGALKSVRDLPGVSLAAKRDILKNYLKVSPEIADVLMDNEIGQYFQRHLSIQPSERKINMHRIVYTTPNGLNIEIADPDGKILEYTPDQLLQAGEEEQTARAKKVWRYR
jgi:hypothetical protein